MMDWLGPLKPPSFVRGGSHLKGRATLNAVLYCSLGLLSAGSQAFAEQWSFRVAPYAWLAGLEGNLATLEGVPQASVELSFGDLLENLDFAGFVAGEARRGDFFLRSDLSYAAISASARPPGDAFSNADVKSRSLQVSAAAGWTVYENNELRGEVFGGARLWHLSTDLDLDAGTQPALSLSSDKTFVDPIVGLSGEWSIAPDWSLGASASIGGFGVAADIEYGGTLAAFWQAGERWGLAFGYRYIAVNYQEDGFVFDVEQHGPLFGAFIDF